MGVIKVNYATMDQAAQSLQATRDEIDALLQDFKAGGAQLMGHMEGEEQRSLQGAIERTQRSFDALSVFVDQQRAAVIRHAENTSATDRAQAAKWA